MATTERMGVDPLAVIRAHAESHRSRAESDAYSAQEAPKLEAAIDAVAELVAADREYDAAKAGKIEADNRITAGDRSDDAFRRQANAHHAYDRAVDRRLAALAPFSEAQS